MAVYLGSNQVQFTKHQIIEAESRVPDIIQGTISGTYSNDIINFIGPAIFYDCSALTSINLPNCSYIGSYAFRDCSALTSISFPNCSYIGNYVFCNCYTLTSINLPNCSYIGNYVFSNCQNLLSLYLLGSSIPTLNNINAFNSTPISTYTISTGGVYGSIYVPASLYNSYLTATNWSVYSARIVSV